MWIIDWLLARPSFPDEVGSVVFRRLNSIVRIMDSNERLDAALTELADIRRRAEKMEDSEGRAAYLYWVPYFEEKAKRHKNMNDRRRRVNDTELKVPRP